MIDSRAVVEAAYAPLAERAPTLDAADYRVGRGPDRATQFGAEQPDCEGALEGTDDAPRRRPPSSRCPRDQFHPGRRRASIRCLYAE